MPDFLPLFIHFSYWVFAFFLTYKYWQAPELIPDPLLCLHSSQGDSQCHGLNDTYKLKKISILVFPTWTLSGAPELHVQLPSPSLLKCITGLSDLNGRSQTFISAYSSKCFSLNLPHFNERYLHLSSLSPKVVLEFSLCLTVYIQPIIFF